MICRQSKNYVVLPLIAEWHSVLPYCPAYMPKARFYILIDNNVIIAVAAWSIPVARMLNHKGYYELRRLAVRPGAPRNTCSKFLSLMRKDIAATMPEVTQFLSYQDTERHHGTIYKADNWRIGWTSAKRKSTSRTWATKSDYYEGSNPRHAVQSHAAKIAWVKDARKNNAKKNERKTVDIPRPA